MAMAEKGSGAFLSGKAVKVPPSPDFDRLSGCLHLSGYDRDLAAAAARNFEDVGPLLVLHCAGLEYQLILSGRLHYAVYCERIHGTMRRAFFPRSGRGYTRLISTVAPI